jgi:hypothetical protein
MFRPSLCGALCLTVAMLGAAGCDDNTGTPPIVPTPVEITEPPFTGTLTINGGVTQSFSVNGTGTVTAILDSLTPNPDNSVVIGVQLGTWNGTSCQIVLTNDNAGVGSGVAGQANAAGSLCARVYDVGRLTEPVTFSLTIKHF